MNFVPGWQGAIFQTAAEAGIELGLEFIEGRSATGFNPSFAGVGFGDGPGHVFVTIAVSNSSGMNGNQVTGVTIGGVPATRVLRNTEGSKQGNTEIWVAETSDTSGSIVMAASGGYNRWSIAVYRVVGLLSIIPHDTLVNDITQTLDVLDGGVVIAVGASTFTTSPGTIDITAPTPGTMPTDYTISAGSVHGGVHASMQPMAAQTLTLDIDLANSQAVISLAP